MAEHDIRKPDDTLEEGASVRQWLRDLEPLFSQDAGEVREAMRAKGSVTHFVGRPAVAVCRLAVVRESQRSEIVWLLPINFEFDDLRRLLGRCLTEAGRRFPAALDWPVRGSFGFGIDARMRALTWQQVFPNAEVRGIRVTNDPQLRRWSIQLPTLRAAIATVRTWS